MGPTEYLVVVEKYGPGRMGRMYRNFRASASLGKPRMKYGAWWPKRSGCISTSWSGTRTLLPNR